ncbi:MAG: DUF1028 domain-containing protein [Acidobacteria bacterium]|nr:DUF1028 domain-containing protein [Acidobacteriota bacterium]
MSKRRALITVLASLLAVPALDATPPSGLRPVSTYSIVARDPATGALGVAVQSHWFSVGSLVVWAEAGVGAVATQSFVDPSYGRNGLDLMRSGKSAGDALRALVAGDEGRDVRQVAFVDASGRVAAHTGAKCIEAAGHLTGEAFSVQANMMRSATVWPAMEKAFREARGDLASRLLAALEAAEAAGGDIRGRQSAAMLVVSGKSTGKPWVDTIVNVRVDDSPQPLVELRRLVQLQRAYNLMNEGDLAVEKKDDAAALAAYGAAQKLEPTNLEMAYWTAVSLVNMGKVDDALPILFRVYASDASWRELTARLPKAGLLPNDPALLRRLSAPPPMTISMSAEPVAVPPALSAASPEPKASPKAAPAPAPPAAPTAVPSPKEGTFDRYFGGKKNG